MYHLCFETKPKQFFCFKTKPKPFFCYPGANHAQSYYSKNFALFSPPGVTFCAARRAVDCGRVRCASRPPWRSASPPSTRCSLPPGASQRASKQERDDGSMAIRCFARLMLFIWMLLLRVLVLFVSFPPCFFFFLLFFSFLFSAHHCYFFFFCSVLPLPSICCCRRTGWSSRSARWPRRR